MIKTWFLPSLFWRLRCKFLAGLCLFPWVSWTDACTDPHMNTSHLITSVNVGRWTPISSATWEPQECGGVMLPNVRRYNHGRILLWGGRLTMGAWYNVVGCNQDVLYAPQQHNPCPTPPLALPSHITPVESRCGMVESWCGMVESWCGMVESWYWMVESWCGMVESWCGMVESWYGMVQVGYGMVESWYGMVASSYGMARSW